MQKLAIFVVILIIQSFAVVYGQYLAAGNPQLNMAEPSVLSDKELAFSLTYFHGYANKYFYEDHVFNNLKTIKSAYTNYAVFKSAYGFTPKLSASVELGYFFNKTINYQDSSQNGHGLGDAAVYMRYRLIYSKNAKFIMLPFVGIKLPIGFFDQKSAILNLPIEVQPASGNFKYMTGIYMSKVINDKLSVASLCSYEYAQLIDSENFYYKYGDQWMLSFLANYKFSERLSSDLQFRFETKDKSHLALSKIIESSGYKILLVCPQITYDFINNWQISVYTQLPLYRYYNGTQLSSCFSVSVRILKKLDLKF
jgi:hypothetical protein